MRRKPSWETTAKRRWSGEKANSLRLPLPIDQRASGLRASLLFFCERVNRGRCFSLIVNKPLYRKWRSSSLRLWSANRSVEWWCRVDSSTVHRICTDSHWRRKQRNSFVAMQAIWYMSPSFYRGNSSNGNIRDDAVRLPLAFTYTLVKHFLFFALHVDVLNLSFGKADQDM